MTQPITDQRPRAELIAELYDLHAAGMFAYCADQLGDLGSASDVLAAVFSRVPAVAPPRAALYAFARREIHRRDVLYSPPAVDPLTDPATALVERALRELRPHQREVLVLCAVCELSTEELAWVLGVASDTAEELVMSAGQRFRQSLGAALASTGPRLPKPVADVFGALAVAPLPDVLGRLPWPQPPGALRIHFAGSRTAAPGPLFVKPRWPSPPVWPQPPAKSDPATSTVIFPAELMTPPSGDRTATHEATTAPMPKYRDSAGGDLLESPVPLRDPLGSTRAFRLPHAVPAKPKPSTPEGPFFLAAPPSTGVEPFATGDVILPKGAPDPYMTGDVLVHQGPARSARRRPPPPPEPQPTPVEFLRLSPPESD
ncbi:sigma-70 family RNA polymerase sigma factor, partial [Nonomuraea terrae]